MVEMKAEVSNLETTKGWHDKNVRSYADASGKRRVRKSGTKINSIPRNLSTAYLASHRHNDHLHTSVPPTDHTALLTLPQLLLPTSQPALQSNTRPTHDMPLHRLIWIPPVGRDDLVAKRTLRSDAIDHRRWQWCGT